METSENSLEVIQTNTLTPNNLPNIQDIKREMCDEDLTSKLDKYDDFDFEPFHENIFRTLSAHFSNKSNINEIDDACLKLENCFIENNILDKNGLTKSTLKGSPNSCVFLKYRDIDDAFVDMVISESVSKFKNNKSPPKKIDLKHFKDNFFSFDFNDYEDAQSQSSDSDSEVVGESESFIEPPQFEVDIHDCYNSDIESSVTEDTDLLSLDNFVNSGYPRNVRLEKLSSHTNNSNSTDLSPLKGTVRDVRIMVEKLRCNLSDGNNIESGNLFREISSSKSYGTKIRQVAKKKTGGMVINTNIPESNDAESNKEPKSSLPSNEDNMVPDGFDKMTRSDRRKLEKIIAESRANLGSRSDQLIFEKNYVDMDISNEKESDETSTIDKESITTSNEREAASTSNERESAGTSDDMDSNTRSNEKEDVDAGSSEDKLNENELLKSVVKNTILDFLIKSKGLKLGKEKVDLISDEITKKLNSFIPDEDGTDADDQTSINTRTSSSDDNKMENNAPIKSNETNVENISKKRPTPPKKRTTKRTSSASTRKRLQEFQEIARDIINCELSTPLVDDLEESLRPTTRQSLAKNDTEVHVDDVAEEPRRPITRQSLAKNDKDKILAGDEHEEPKKPTTRQSIAKLNTDISVDAQEEPRRPVTRQSITKNDKIVLSNELPKETKRLPNTATKVPTAKSDKDIISIRDEEAKQSQSAKDNDTVIVPDDDLEEPRRPATRRFVAKNDKDIITIDLEKEEPKKPVARKTVAELERSMALGSTLSSSLDSEIEEPTRRTTRQSLQKQKEISKGSPECSVLTNELKSESSAPKRKSNARTKKNSAKRSGNKQRTNNKKTEMEAISRDSSVVDLDINEDSIISLSDSDTSKSSKITNSSFCSGHTILKASADSTTFETEPNEESAISAADGNTHCSSTNTELNAMNKNSSLPPDSEIIFNKSNIHINSEKSGDEESSRPESDKNHLVDDDVCLPDTSVSVGSFSNWGHSDSSSDTTDDNLKNVSKLIEDVLDESMRDKLSLNQESTEQSPFNKSFSAILNPPKDKKVPQPVDEPFQILNDMITDIEERLLKEETETNKSQTENELSKDIGKSSVPDKDFFNYPSVAMEISADSTSFLNYTLDDSLKLMIDEGTPQKEGIIKERDSPKPLSIKSKENEEKNNSKKVIVETSTVLTNSSNATGSKEDLNKEVTIGSKREVEKSHSEESGLKNDNKETEESEKEVEPRVYGFEEDGKKTDESVEEDEMNHSGVSSLKDVNKQAILESKKEIETPPREEIMVEKPDEKLTDHRINEKDILSSTSIDQKFSSFCKPLTIEQKIAQLTKRDPRLVNDKKIPNVNIRDPRLRNKLPKIDEKRENVSAVQKISVSKVNEEKEKLAEKFEPKVPETESAESLRVDHKLPESKHFEEKKKISDQKLPEQKSSEPKLVVSKISEPKLLSSLPESSTASLLKDLSDTSQETEEKLSVPSQKSIKSLMDINYEQNRKKRFKKTIDEELLYKTPLSDLHDTQAERSTYEREKDFKKKKLFPEGRRVRIITEERNYSIPRRVRTVDESTEEKRDYNQSTVATNSQGFFRRESQGEPNFGRPNSEVPHLRADHRYSEEVRYSKENLTYEEKTFYQERKEIFPSGSNENYEQGSCIRRLVTETSYSETVHSRNDFQDNHIYSRREFFRRNRYAHDHDHLGNSSRLLENSSNIRNDNEIYPQRNNFPVAEEPTFSVSAYPPVSFLPEPMYSQEEDIDQSYGNMETESFSPPSSDLCPPPPLIRSPTPEIGRRDNYCPSPPRIGRRDSTDERDYEEFSRAYHRNYENDRGFRGRSNSSRGSGNFRRGNGREFHRWRDESPPRKRFAGENFRGRDDDRVVRWRRSPSWSPERSRRWSRERSPPLREPHPWNSPREAHPWNSPPREQHPWNSPPRNRSPSPPRRRDNYRDRSSYYHRY